MRKRACNPYICPLSLGQILASYEEFIAYYIDPCHNNLGTARGQESETRNIGSFSGVKVTEGIDVYLKRGDKESVRVEVTGTKLGECYYGGFRFVFTRSYARWQL